MAMFFDFPVNAPNSYTPIVSRWHSRASLLAVGAKEQRHNMTTGSVSMYTEDGEHLSQATLQRSALPTDVFWHPTEQTLATGWASGEVLLYHEATQQATECKRVHESSIVFVRWAVDGSRLITGDEDGLVCFWSVSSQGQASLVNELRLPAAVVHCCPVGIGRGSSSTFYVATDAHVYRVDASGDSEVVLQCDGTIHALTFDDRSNLLVAITIEMTVVQHRVTNDGLAEKYLFKLAGKVPGETTWAGKGILAIATGENQIRLWDSDAGDLYSLSIADENGEFTPSDILSAVAFDPRSHILAAGSRNGFVFMWKHKGFSFSATGSEAWTFQSPVEIDGNLKHLTWGPNSLLAAQNDTNNVSILREHIMRKAFANNVAAIQVSSARLVVEVLGVQSHSLDGDFTIKGVSVTNEAIVVWGAKEVAIYELVKEGSVLRSSHSFKCDATACALHTSSVYTATEDHIDARAYNGAAKQLLTFDKQEGTITHMAASGDHLVAATNNGIIRTWDLSRREARLSAGPHSIAQEVDTLRQVAICSNGSYVAFFGQADMEDQPMVWLWAVDSGKTQPYSLGVGHVPQSICWDSRDPRLLIIESKSEGEAGESHKVTSCFATPDKGLVQHHTFELGDEEGALLGAQVPLLHFTKRSKSDDTMITSQPLRDFKGLEDADRDTREAMLEFSYQLTLGNLDEAFKAVRVIQSDDVWINMARMCVGTQRMDVAAVCMGRMGNAVAARALREAADETDEAKAAILAIHLGMHEEAEKLLKESQRFDILVQLYRDSNRWEDALATAGEHDRLHLKNTYYEQAKHLESMGQLQDALRAYERSDTHKHEVPRLLLDNPTVLEAYVRQAKSKELLQWWAQYQESLHDMDEALRYYSAADDVLSLVRVYCFQDNVDKAHELVQRTQDKAAAYHLARFYEAKDEIEKAIDLYSLSECYTNAIRLAKEHGMKDQMLNLALNSTKVDMISAGEFYEQQGMIDKAVMLYHKGGRVGKALEMCFEHQSFKALGDISADLDEDTDPALLQRAAEFFVDHKQYDKAVNLLIVSKRFDDALALIEQHNVHLTEENAERMTYAKGEVDKKVRSALLERIADIANAQGSYQLATKKYTQATKLTKAMRALLRGGDTEKIMFFAKKCRQKDVYVMAANYLQSLNWRQDGEIMKNIITFYTQGRALDSLALFYESCAQAEIDDYQNYEKALGALNEALKCLSKAKMKDMDEQERRVSSLQTRIMHTQRFVDVRGLAESNPAAMMDEASNLLHEPGIEEAIRIGDVYGMMIEYLASQEKYSEAYQLIKELRARAANVDLSFYVSMPVIEAIHRALDIPLGSGSGGNRGEDEVAEEIAAEEV